MLHSAWSHATGLVLGPTIALSPRIVIIEADEVLLLAAT
jgi:hypothetical protein